MHDLLHDIAISVIAATVLGLLAHRLRQPIILGYLVAGALVGPEIGLGWIHGSHSIEIISELGLALLLFSIGLEMNVKQLLASGRQLLVAGFGQFLVCAILGVAVFGVLGYGLRGQNADGLYLALLCGLSSTAIVVKLLYDKGELDTLPGRLTLGILVVQDIYAIFILAFQPNFSSPSVRPILLAVMSTVGLLTGGMLFSRYVLARLFTAIAKTPEMVLAVSLGWCAAVASMAYYMGLSKEMGALVAGLSISAYPYSIHVTAKTLPLRDFFLTLFFMSLGMKIVAPTPQMVLPVLLIVGFTVASRFMSVYPLIVLSGGGRRAAFVASLNLAQISEFSLVIASLGVGYGHIQQGTVANVIYAMAITAILSSYGIRYSHPLFRLVDGAMQRLRPGREEQPEPAAHAEPPGLALLGYHRGARAAVEAIEKAAPELLKRILVIDFNPLSLDELRAKGVPCMFGDISSLGMLQHAHLAGAKIIASTIPDMLLKGTDNVSLVRAVRSIAPQATIVATADDAKHEQRLRAEGAAMILRPYDLAGQSLAATVAEALSPPPAEPVAAESARATVSA